MADKILSKFPEFNRVFLLTGLGSMLINEDSTKENFKNDEIKYQKEINIEEKLNLLLEKTTEVLSLNKVLMEENKKLSAEREELKEAYENLDNKFDNLTLLFDMYMSPIYRSMGLNRIDLKDVKEQITKSEK